MSTLTEIGNGLSFQKAATKSSDGLFKRAFAGIAKSREAYARRLVADAMLQFSDAQLTGLGYSSDDILRLRNRKQS
jgi:hypothetical protein